VRIRRGETKYEPQLAVASGRPVPVREFEEF
jgi:hypothetical protein